SDLDEATQKRIERGKRVAEILKQPQYAPMDEYEEIISIYAATTGQLDELPVDKIRQFEEKIVDFVKVKNKKLLAKLKSGDKMDDKTQKELNALIASFIKTLK